jgi:hypothetical protein
MSENLNEQLLLISGESTSGKSMALRNLPDQENWFYLNCEAGKRLPFRNKFDSYTITDPYQVFDAFDAARDDSNNRGIIIDTLTFLMDMFESVHVLTATDKQAAWGQYGQYFKTLMQQYVATFPRPVIFLAHTRTEIDQQGNSSTAVPVKGALKNNGIEAYFSTVLSTKTMPIRRLEGQNSTLLNINEDEEEVGFKHVFQTRLTKDTTGERIRSPLGMWERNQTYIDNDANAVLDHMMAYYA